MSGCSFALGRPPHLEQRLDTHKRMEFIDRQLKKYPYRDAKLAINFMGAYKFRELFPKEVYATLSPYPFEDLTLLAPTDYDRVLRQLYGDYMTPPPESEQNKHGTVTGDSQGDDPT